MDFSTPVPARKDESHAVEFPQTMTVIVAAARQRISCDILSEYSLNTLEVFKVPKEEDKTAAIVTNRLIDLENTMSEPDWTLIRDHLRLNNVEIIAPDEAENQFMDSALNILQNHLVETSGHIVGEGFLKVLLFTAMLSAESATKGSPGDVSKYTVWLMKFFEQNGLEDRVLEKGGWNALQLLTEEEMQMIPLNDHKVFQRTTTELEQSLPPITLQDVLSQSTFDPCPSGPSRPLKRKASETPGRFHQQSPENPAKHIPPKFSQVAPQQPQESLQMSPQPQRSPQMSPQPQGFPQRSPQPQGFPQMSSQPQRTPHSTSSPAPQQSPYRSPMDYQEEDNEKLPEAFKMHSVEELISQRQSPPSSSQAAFGPMPTTHRAPRMAENKAVPSPPTLIVITAVIRNRIRADITSPYARAALNAFYVSPENDHLAAKVSNRVSDSETCLSENERSVLCEEFSRLLTLDDATSFDSEYKTSMKRIMRYGSTDTLVITSIGILRILILTSMLAAEFAKYGQMDKAVKFVSLFTMFCCDNHVESWVAANGGWNNLYYQEKDLYNMDAMAKALISEPESDRPELGQSSPTPIARYVQDVPPPSHYEQQLAPQMPLPGSDFSTTSSSSPNSPQRFGNIPGEDFGQRSPQRTETPGWGQDVDDQPTSPSGFMSRDHGGFPEQTAQTYATGQHYDPEDSPSDLYGMDDLFQSLEAVNPPPGSTPGVPYQVPKNSPEAQRLRKRQHSPEEQ